MKITTWYLIYIWEKTHPLHSFNMAERISNRFSAGEALEDIFADEDSEDENFNCGSDIEYVLNSENESASKESDLDDSITLPNRS